MVAGPMGLAPEWVRKVDTVRKELDEERLGDCSGRDWVPERHMRANSGPLKKSKGRNLARSKSKIRGTLEYQAPAPLLGAVSAEDR